MASSSSTNLIQSNQQHSQHRSPYTKIKQDSKLNVAAPAFVYPSFRSSSSARALRGGESMPEIGYIGPTQLPVNSRVWSSISSYPLEQFASYQSTTPNQLFQYYQKQQQQQQHREVSPSPSSNYEPLHQFGPTVLTNGIIQLRLRNSVVIEMTVDRSVKLINHHERVTIALSSTGTSSALTHPNGIVFQNGSRVDIAAFDGRMKNPYVRYAKMWQKGISLTSEGCALIYLVDAAGTRTTSDVINIDPKVDYISPVFYNGTRIGTQFCQEANQIAQCCNFWLNDDGTETFHLNGFRIQQTVDGLVKIARTNNRCNIRTSPTNGSATITTPYIHCTASMGQTSHLFVRREERRMHFDGSSFVVRNAGHSAGFDEWNRLRVY
ncbi:uncharacterized protein LOC129779564 [Toxorhynchites rutilus septentrionalis]|uniref:uncharacterized protein LOC129779564 n=1 Tax=Toxorhynchites rutilus septentrionalis TaxID=329112 RepID=UPI00247944D8|nr:uncharacterized protein LOC129779564 [Toxorhynchites rutilus septentrionalis]